MKSTASGNLLASQFLVKITAQLIDEGINFSFGVVLTNFSQISHQTIHSRRDLLLCFNLFLIRIVKGKSEALKIARKMFFLFRRAPSTKAIVKYTDEPQSDAAIKRIDKKAFGGTNID